MAQGANEGGIVMNNAQDIDFSLEFRREQARAFRDIAAVLGTSIPERPPGWVYIIGVEGQSMVKIGFAQNPKARFANLKTDNFGKLILLQILPGSSANEHEIHRHFAEQHHRGEWFGLQGALAAALEKAGTMLHPWTVIDMDEITRENG